MALTQLGGDLSPQPPNPFYVPLGAASPLWLMFAGAASAGVAYWWMTRWTSAIHLEAAFGEVALAAPAPEPEAIVLDEPAALTEAVEVAQEVAVERSPMVDVASEAAVEARKPKVKPRPSTDVPPTA
jgi:hypothetical protein